MMGYMFRMFRNRPLLHMRARAVLYILNGMGDMLTHNSVKNGRRTFKLGIDGSSLVPPYMTTVGLSNVKRSKVKVTRSSKPIFARNCFNVCSHLNNKNKQISKALIHGSSANPSRHPMATPAGKIKRPNGG